MKFLTQHITLLLGVIAGSLLGATIVLTLLLQNARRDADTLVETHRAAALAMQEEIRTRDGRILELENLLTETKNMLEDFEEKTENLEDDLRDEKDRNDEFEDQIEKIGSTVGTLDKLAKTDKELLMKYSKVYFLNEHYTPPKLREIPKEFTRASNGDPEFIHGDVRPFLVDLLTDAKEDGISLLVGSAFRSFDEQRELKGVYTVTYGSGANTFSADQGYSEHQLGTTIDFTTDNLGGGLQGFETTPAYLWLQKNAYRYGFVLSYPEGNAYYMFEPWHWRFVGTDLARTLHTKGTNFYDLDQRDIDSYLISLFD